MKLALFVSATLCCATLPSESAMAHSVTLQTVEIDGQSAEGGQGILYRDSAGLCRIKTVYFGEGGRVKFEFEFFGARLRWAFKKEYRYEVPYYIPPDERHVSSVRTTTLSSAEGRRILPPEFRTSRAYFDAVQIAKCSGN